VTVTRLAMGAGVVVLGLLIWLAVIGSAAVTALLVTVAALVVLVAGGNWLGGKNPHGRGGSG
jgi:hypothetical protein